jgi:hypothetical protein
LVIGWVIGIVTVGVMSGLTTKQPARPSISTSAPTYFPFIIEHRSFRGQHPAFAAIRPMLKGTPTYRASEVQNLDGSQPVPHTRVRCSACDVMLHWSELVNAQP